MIDDIIRKIKAEIRKMELEIYDDYGDAHDEGDLGRLEGMEMALDIIEKSI